jgi:hypothetical protein
VVKVRVDRALLRHASILETWIWGTTAAVTAMPDHHMRALQGDFEYWMVLCSRRCLRYFGFAYLNPRCQSPATRR